LRLLDHVAQCTAPLLVRQASGDLWQLPGPSDYAQEVIRCPLRYVLSDELVKACIELAYSDGSGLSGCRDLVHFPAERLWIEWNRTPQHNELSRLLPECVRTAAPGSLRNGALVYAHPNGRSGRLRTFWLPASEPREPLLAAAETLLDLDSDAPDRPCETFLEGHAVPVGDAHSAHVDGLMRCASFRLDPLWQRYYASVAHSAAERTQVICRSLETVAFDVPMLLALFLLMGLRADLKESPVRPIRLNVKRARHGKQPLLEHVEISCPVFASTGDPPRSEEWTTPRIGPRMHHVRGHIVRRRNAVFWRRPHWRGHLRLGSVRSRTVLLTHPGPGTGVPTALSGVARVGSDAL
jgi:hypothetical protein